MTGAGNGIGRAIAKALAHEGAGLLVTDIAAEAGQSVANEIRHIGRQAHFVLADLSDQEAPQRIFEAAIERFGKVSLLIHCASPPHWGRTLVSAPEEDWSRMIAVNVMAACRLGRLVGEHMRTNEIRGRMLFITSLHARDSEPWACGALCGRQIRVANVEQATCLLLRPFRNSREFDRAGYDCGKLLPLV